MHFYALQSVVIVFLRASRSLVTTKRIHKMEIRVLKVVVGSRVRRRNSLSKGKRRNCSCRLTSFVNGRDSCVHPLNGFFWNLFPPRGNNSAAFKRASSNGTFVITSNKDANVIRYLLPLTTRTSIILYSIYISLPSVLD